MEEYLKETKYLNYNDKILKSFTLKLVTDLNDDREKALKIFLFVRDGIKFGFNRKFYDMKASEVFEARRGFCNNKSTLFVSMLRCVGIPARQVFVDIDKKILEGITSPPTPYVDHTYSEVYLNNKWIKVDSYIVDNELFRNAKLKLLKSNTNLGYGVHKEGVNTWDGENDAFSQFYLPDAGNISTKTYGSYADIDEFYKKEKNTWNKSNFIQNTVFLLFSFAMNNSADKIRNEIYNS